MILLEHPRLARLLAGRWLHPRQIGAILRRRDRLVREYGIANGKR